MSTQSPTVATTSTRTRRLFALNAASAWIGLAISCAISIPNLYPYTPTVSSLYGNNPDGWAGLIPRTIDWLSYFTIWSNAVVAIVMTMLARRPDRDGRLFRVLRMDSLVMISVTGLVYGVMLAPYAQLEGLEYVSNAFNHYLTPIVTIVVWLVAGPRGWITWRILGQALVLPVGWAAYVLVRGAVLGAYPYNLLDVATLGYPTVLVTIVAIALLGVLIGAAYMGLDRLRRGRAA